MLAVLLEYNFSESSIFNIDACSDLNIQPMPNFNFTKVIYFYKIKSLNIKYQTLKTSVGHAWPPMAIDSTQWSHEAMEPCDHPGAMEGRRMPSIAIGDHAWPALVFTV